MSTVVKALEKARTIISKPGAWTQGVYARSAKGNPVGTLSKVATCFCALGAVRRAVPDIHKNRELAARTRQALAAALPKGSYLVGQFNDAPERTQEQVVALFDRAIAKAKEGEASVRT